MTGYLEIHRADKRFGGFRALNGVNLSVQRGEFVSLLGPSGCGKTSLLRSIAGLMNLDGGTIRLGGRDLTKVPAHRRNIGVVFQNYALFPHLNVADNVAFGLRATGANKADTPHEVMSALALVRMEGFAQRPITTLSGGQQQRVAVARALATKPSLLLLDEPFSALDRKLRETMQIELRQLLKKLDITAVFVTHDQDEAFVMSDRIAVMDGGEIKQFADASTIYCSPSTTSTLSFVGMSTRLEGRVTGQEGEFVTIETPVGTLRALASKDFSAGSQVLVAVRPENFAIGLPERDDMNAMRCQIGEQAFLGSKTQLYLNVPSGSFALAEVNPSVASKHRQGDWIDLNWPVKNTLLYPLQEGTNTLGAS